MSDGKRRLVVSEFVTLDGVMEDPGGAEKFERGGWAFQFERGPEGDKFKVEELEASDTFLLGRLTYLEFAKAWPSRTGDFADRMNNTPKYVVSNTLKKTDWKNSQVVNGNLAEEVSKLKAMPGKDILVAGSGQLVRALLEHDLVDELRLMVFPVVLGAGGRLFAETSDKKPMRLLDTQTLEGGIAYLTYQAVRDA